MSTAWCSSPFAARKGHVKCFCPVPLDEEPEQARPTGLGQLRLLTEEGAELLSSMP